MTGGLSRGAVPVREGNVAWAGVGRPAAEATHRAPDADAPRRIVFLTRSNAPATGLPTPTLRRRSPVRVKPFIWTRSFRGDSAPALHCSRNQDRRNLAEAAGTPA